MAAVTWPQLGLAIAAAAVLLIMLAEASALADLLQPQAAATLSPADIEDAIAGCIRLAREAGNGA